MMRFTAPTYGQSGAWPGCPLLVHVMLEHCLRYCCQCTRTVARRSTYAPGGMPWTHPLWKLSTLKPTVGAMSTTCLLLGCGANSECQLSAQSIPGWPSYNKQ